MGIFSVFWTDSPSPEFSFFPEYWKLQEKLRVLKAANEELCVLTPPAGALGLLALRLRTGPCFCGPWALFAITLVREA